MITKLYSSTVIGIETHLVTVEVMVKYDKHGFQIVGMGDKAVQESKKRISAALSSVGIDIDKVSITVNLAPADIKKTGSNFDFPIAVAIMQALRKIRMAPGALESAIILGEISFDGSLRPVSGVMAAALDAQNFNKTKLIVPLANQPEAAMVPDVESIGILSLDNFIDYIEGKGWRQAAAPVIEEIKQKVNDFGSIKGQRAAKRMIQIAVAGNHNFIMVGPPGSGKTMLSQAIPSIMPPMSDHEVVETTRIYSAAHYQRGMVKTRPFRSPHHGISQAGMVGGGSPIQPGEISLANNGILFLDELTEFKRSVIEALRQPLEDKSVTISRANSSVTLPCSFMMVCALNPCPCGYLGDERRSCSCTSLTIYNYLKKISGPFLDRIDLQIFLQSINLQEIEDKSGLTSSQMADGVMKARQAQYQRYGNDYTFNGQLSSEQIDKHCQMTEAAKKILSFCFEKFQMSMRSYHKVIKVSRTIADIDGEGMIQESHIKEAFMYRGIDQKLTMLKSKI